MLTRKYFGRPANQSFLALHHLLVPESSSRRFTQKSTRTLLRWCGRSGCLRGYTTGSDSEAPSSSNSSPPPDSIFSPSESPWDHLFDKIDQMPPLLPPRSPRQTGKTSPTESSGGSGSGASATGTTNTVTGRRRQAMTAREISAFDEMFNMIFNAVSEHKLTPTPTPTPTPTASASTSASQRQQHPDTLPLSDELAAIGRGPAQTSRMTDLFGKLRRHSRKMKWTSELDEQLDRKKEEMDRCDTDQELLEWATREVFGESKRYEAAASQAIANAALGKQEGKGEAAAAAAARPSTETTKTMPTLQPETYPHLLAHLMRAFRDKYHDPYLALAMFDHARHLSIPSYVFGCSTAAYNELIETRWSCFRDLKGVYDALEEMNVNGVLPDSRTRRLVEVVRRQVDERNRWEEEHDSEHGDVFSILAKIEAFAVKDASKGARNRQSHKPLKIPWDGWKATAIDSQPDDEWEFDQWHQTRKSSFQ